MYIESTADLRDLLIARIHEHDEAESEEAVAAIAALEGATTMQGLRDAVAELDSDLDPDTVFESDEVQDAILAEVEAGADTEPLRGAGVDAEPLGTVDVARDGLTYTVCAEGRGGEKSTNEVRIQEPDDVALLVEAVEAAVAGLEESHADKIDTVTKRLFEAAQMSCMQDIDAAETADEAQAAIATCMDDWDFTAVNEYISRHDRFTETELQGIFDNVQSKLNYDAELEAHVEERVAELGD